MPSLVRHSLTNRDVHNRQMYGATKNASHGGDRSGAQTHSRTQEERAELLMAAQKYTVAVVDDDPSMLKALGRLLAESGYSVELFASFAEVLKQMPSSKAMCILIDCQLGQFSGLELARQLNASGFGFPIIFMTASDDDGMRQQAMAIGCAGFLRKPFLMNQLLEAVSKTKDIRPV